MSCNNSFYHGAQRRLLSLMRRLQSLGAEDAYRLYITSGAAPWSGRYSDARAAVVREALNSPFLMELFRSGTDLPSGYGVGIDERCVEYPYVLARLDERDNIVLDAGSALNHDYVLDASAMQGRTVHIVTLAPEGYRQISHRVSYLYGDLADLWYLADQSYDAVVCISTLEHIGMDNAGFGVDSGSATAASNPLGKEARALREMWRLLRPGGSLFVTVPYGVGTSSSMRVYDVDAVNRLSSLLPVLPAVEYFRYWITGWTRATEKECADARYVSWIMESEDTRGKPPCETDRAAAARAIVALTYIKPNKGAE